MYTILYCKKPISINSNKIQMNKNNVVQHTIQYTQWNFQSTYFD